MKEDSNIKEGEPQLVRLPTVLQLVGLSRAEIYRRIKEGSFPAPVPIGERAVAFNLPEVRSWVRARLLQRDADRALRSQANEAAQGASARETDLSRVRAEGDHRAAGRTK